MVKKKVFFACGFPRAGSTVGLAILNQHPDVAVTATSPVSNLLGEIKAGWWNYEAVRAMRQEQAIPMLHDILASTFEGAYKQFDAPVVIDKSRGWPALAEMLEAILDYDVRFVAFVRSYKSIIASLEKLFRRTLTYGMPSQAMQQPQSFNTMPNRAQYWTDAQALFGSAYNTLKDAIDRGHREKFLFVKYEDMVSAPKATFEKIGNHIGLAPFDFDFDHIDSAIEENDMIAYRFLGLHSVGETLKQPSQTAADILGELASQFGHYEDWIT